MTYDLTATTGGETMEAQRGQHVKINKCAANSGKHLHQFEGTCAANSHNTREMLLMQLQPQPQLQPNETTVVVFVFLFEGVF